MPGLYMVQLMPLPPHQQLAGWPSGSGIAQITKLLCIKSLTRWVTDCRCAILLCNQPSRPTQPPILSRWEMSARQG